MTNLPSFTSSPSSIKSAVFHCRNGHSSKFFRRFAPECIKVCLLLKDSDFTARKSVFFKNFSGASRRKWRNLPWFSNLPLFQSKSLIFHYRNDHYSKIFRRYAPGSLLKCCFWKSASSIARNASNFEIFLFLIFLIWNSRVRCRMMRYERKTH